MVTEFDDDAVETLTFGAQASALGGLKHELDAYLLVILDACRYDALASMVQGAVRPMLSPATNTGMWIRGVWPGEYDAVYVAGNPHLSEPEDRPGMSGLGGTYYGDDHFAAVVDTYLVGWDGTHGTVPPAAVRDDAIDHRDHDRVIAHFMQPHTPYIGERQPDRELTAWHLVEEDTAWLEGIDRGEIAGWYLDNLARVWEEGVEPLVKAFDDRPIFITADHGEALGEGGIYGHGSVSMAVLVVPWLALTPPGWGVDHA